MCNISIRNCERCELYNDNYDSCQEYILENPKKAVEVIESWSVKHPIKTRQSEMLKMFPMTQLNEEGIIDIPSCDVDTSLAGDSRCKDLDCRTCKKLFWETEIEE